MESVKIALTHSTDSVSTSATGAGDEIGADAGWNKSAVDFNGSIPGTTGGTPRAVPARGAPLAPLGVTLSKSTEPRRAAWAFRVHGPVVGGGGIGVSMFVGKFGSFVLPFAQVGHFGHGAAGGGGDGRTGGSG